MSFRFRSLRKGHTTTPSSVTPEKEKHPPHMPSLSLPVTNTDATSVIIVTKEHLPTVPSPVTCPTISEDFWPESNFDNLKMKTLPEKSKRGSPGLSEVASRNSLARRQSQRSMHLKFDYFLCYIGSYDSYCASILLRTNVNLDNTQLLSTVCCVCLDRRT